eukprot:NODE_2450_length_568_cov_90.009070_g2400_i0.p1 GENE.NODE_2450_length_568_cov_90.009070_g2400_i0~~NODE_2450_length_568_cov_90.009070_g2400_i0.p1  ORF type:complete len:168 (-),score=37.50 NODE_2450_length_568_cov_90.009070_g2400_i0:7-510(-)
MLRRAARLCTTLPANAGTSRVIIDTSQNRYLDAKAKKEQETKPFQDSIFTTVEEKSKLSTLPKVTGQTTAAYEKALAAIAADTKLDVNGKRNTAMLLGVQMNKNKVAASEAFLTTLRSICFGDAPTQSSDLLHRFIENPDAFRPFGDRAATAQDVLEAPTVVTSRDT